jgi:D-ribose pyranose/furanose isomerase RbsD
MTSPSLVPPDKASSPATVHFKLNGQNKTINTPVTGAALHRLAQLPTTLVTSAGTPVPNTNAVYDLAQDENLTSGHGFISPAVEAASTHSVASRADYAARVVADKEQLAADVKSAESDKA